MPRTDAHSPTNVITEDYEYEFAAYTGPGGLVGLMSTDEGRAYWHSLIGNLSPETAERGTDQCHHCGARISYVAFLKHVPTGKFIVVGETCLDNRFERTTADFQRLRKQAQLDREQQRIKTMAQEQVDQLLDSEMSAVGNAMGRDIDIATEYDMDPEGYAVRTITDIRSKLWKYGSLSTRQIEFVASLIEKNSGQVARAARIAAEREAEPKCDAPVGRVQIEGTVVSRKWRDNDYGGCYKLTVKCNIVGRGMFLVWLSEPSSLETQRGDVIRLKATLTRSNDKSYFAFGKRPSNAVLVERPSEAPEFDSLFDPDELPF